MTAPTEPEIRDALNARLNHPTDRYARDDDWIGYLSDGLIRFYRADDDSDTQLEPALYAMIEAATPAIAAQCQALAIERLVAIAQAYATIAPDKPQPVGAGR